MSHYGFAQYLTSGHVEVWIHNYVHTIVHASRDCTTYTCIQPSFYHIIDGSSYIIVHEDAKKNKRAESVMTSDANGDVKNKELAKEVILCQSLMATNECWYDISTNVPLL